MKFSRRHILLGGATASATTLACVRSITNRDRQITVYDSRVARSWGFAMSKRGQNIDVAQDPIGLWAALREVSTQSSVTGFTRWSDFIAVRGQLENAGLRVIYMRQQEALLEWAMS